jgi:hypothetical protein
LTEWQLYVQQVEGQSWRGTHLDKAVVDSLNGESIATDAVMPSYQRLTSVPTANTIEDQLRQLYELMKTIRDRRDGKPE